MVHFMNFIFRLAISMMLVGCGGNAEQTEPSDSAIAEKPLILSAELTAQRDSLRTALINAHKRVRQFAARNNWEELAHEPFLDSTEIYADKKSFDRRLRDLFGVDSTVEIPQTACGTIEKGVLTAVSPQLYDALYPEGREPNAYEKLLAHEMAHRLHIRILNGNEEAMGPIWFYEGFALYAADQFAQSDLKLPDSLIWQIVNETERGSYFRYAAIFRHFISRHSLKELIDRAGQPDFVDWLREKDSTK